MHDKVKWLFSDARIETGGDNETTDALESSIHVGNCSESTKHQQQDVPEQEGLTLASKESNKTMGNTIKATGSTDDRIAIE